MRVGHKLARSLDSEKPLFEDEDLSMLPEEIWHADCAGSEYGIPSNPLLPPASGQDLPEAPATTRREQNLQTNNGKRSTQAESNRPKDANKASQVGACSIRQDNGNSFAVDRFPHLLQQISYF